MKSIGYVFVAILTVAFLAGCGLQDNGCDDGRCLDPVCGDGECNGDEGCGTCPADCGQCPEVCGNGVCAGDEDCESCESDCGECEDPVVCGDDTCEGDETCSTCPGDCGACPSECGDDVCDLDEDCESCSEDCGTCPVDPYCGDDTCDEDETCETCESDCGECAPVCGDGVCEDPECASSCPADCEEECTDCGLLPDPFVSPAACTFIFSSHYVSGATCGEARGELPLMTWTNGLEIVDLYEGELDGYMGFAYDPDETEVDAGTYDLSYVGFQSCTEEDTREAWAQYGLLADLLRISETGRAYIQCDWYDADDDACITPSDGSPSCNIRLHIDSDCVVTPAGNMASLNDASAGC